MYLSVLLEQLVNGQVVSLLLEGPLREKIGDGKSSDHTVGTRPADGQIR